MYWLDEFGVRVQTSSYSKVLWWQKYSYYYANVIWTFMYVFSVTTDSFFTKKVVGIIVGVVVTLVVLAILGVVLYKTAFVKKFLKWKKSKMNGSRSSLHSRSSSSSSSSDSDSDKRHRRNKRLRPIKIKPRLPSAQYTLKSKLPPIKGKWRWTTYHKWHVKCIEIHFETTYHNTNIAMEILFYRLLYIPLQCLSLIILFNIHGVSMLCCLFLWFCYRILEMFRQFWRCSDSGIFKFSFLVLNI